MPPWAICISCRARRGSTAVRPRVKCRSTTSKDRSAATESPTWGPTSSALPESLRLGTLVAVRDVPNGEADGVDLRPDRVHGLVDRADQDAEADGIDVGGRERQPP